MSLVNDVLRELNSSSEKPKKALPLHPLVADEPVKKIQIARISFIVVIAFLLLILLLQTFYRISVFDIFMADKNIELQQIETIILQESKRLNEAGMTQKNTATYNVDDEVELINTNQAVSKQTEDQEKENTEQDSNEVVSVDNERPKKVSPEAQSKEQAVEKPRENTTTMQVQAQIEAIEPVRARQFQLAKIKTVENPGFKEYQLALRSYKNGQNKTALAWIDLALSERKKSEYLRLKIRILSQLERGEELNKFVLANKDHTDIAWLELIAPSLQMHGFYELSNNYYAKLIMQQPNEVKWRLAMALNYSKLGLNKQTYSIYKNLLETNLLTNKQKQWIASRLERMGQGGGVSSGS